MCKSKSNQPEDGNDILPVQAVVVSVQRQASLAVAHFQYGRVSGEDRFAWLMETDSAAVVGHHLRNPI